MLNTKKVNDNIQVEFEYGDIKGPYYSEEHPKQEFETEEEAIKYAYEFEKYGRWVVIPIIYFDND